MNVLLVEPNLDPRTIEIDGSLASMQSLVGGLIEAVYPFEAPVALICNDEGKLAGLPQNRPLKHPETGEVYDIIYGTFFVCSAPADSENFESLPDDLIEKYSKVFALPSLVCTSCGNKFYRERRGDTFFRGDEPYCQDCYHSVCDRDAIHDYYYKPTPIFYGDDNRFFGVELEIDGAGEDSDNAAEILHIANAEQPMAYCKHDGSLDEGFEIVTHPMTLDFHLHGMPWERIVEEAKKLGYTSHQAGTCGLHVHVNRTAFGNTESAQDAAIARVLFFFEKFWDELLKFSRRTQGQLNQWAARYGYKDQPKEILDHAKSGRHAGRYTAVNLTNADTVEFRMFRGTLKHNTLIATLELLDCIIDAAIYLTDDDLKAMSWSSFMLGCTKPELIQYLKERRLYINEPIESEGEV